MPFPPRWSLGGIFLTGIGSLVLGLVVMGMSWLAKPCALPRRVRTLGQDRDLTIVP